MAKLEKFIFRGIFGIVALFGTATFLFFYNIKFEIDWLSLIFAFLFGWPAIIVLLIVRLFLS